MDASRSRRPEISGRVPPDRPSKVTLTQMRPISPICTVRASILRTDRYRRHAQCKLIQHLPFRRRYERQSKLCMIRFIPGPEEYLILYSCSSYYMQGKSELRLRKLINNEWGSVKMIVQPPRLIRSCIRLPLPILKLQHHIRTLSMIFRPEFRYRGSVRTLWDAANAVHRPFPESNKEI